MARKRVNPRTIHCHLQYFLKKSGTHAPGGRKRPMKRFLAIFTGFAALAISFAQDKANNDQVL